MKASIFLIAISLLLRLLVLGTYFFNHPDMIFKPDAPDNWEYHFLGKNLVEYHTFSSDSIPPLKLDAIRTPVYPLFIGILYHLFWRFSKDGYFCSGTARICYCLDIFQAMPVVSFGSNGFSCSITVCIRTFRHSVHRFLHDGNAFHFFTLPEFLLFVQVFLQWFPCSLFIFQPFFWSNCSLPSDIQFYIPIILVAILYSPPLRQLTKKKRLMHMVLYLGICVPMIFSWCLRNQIEFGRFKVSLIDEVNLKRHLIPEFMYYTANASCISESENPYHEYLSAVIHDPAAFIDLNIYHVYRYLSDLGRGYLYFPKIFDRYSVTNVIPGAGFIGLIKGDLNDLWRSIRKVILDRPGFKGLAFTCFFLSYLLYLLLLYLLFCVGALRLVGIEVS